jgi:hypothetical protein
MLDPWIIEEIRRREESERDSQRPQLEIPIEMPRRPSTDTLPEGTLPEPPPGEERGVVILEFFP